MTQETKEAVEKILIDYTTGTLKVFPVMEQTLSGFLPLLAFKLINTGALPSIFQ